MTTSAEMVSEGGPRMRNGGPFAIPVAGGGGVPAAAAAAPGVRPPVNWPVRLRVSLSGLYWKTTTLASGFHGSRPTKAPLLTRGDPGNALVMTLLPAARRLSGGPPRSRRRPAAQRAPSRRRAARAPEGRLGSPAAPPRAGPGARAAGHARALRDRSPLAR